MLYTQLQVIITLKKHQCNHGLHRRNETTVEIKCKTVKFMLIVRFYVKYNIIGQVKYIERFEIITNFNNCFRVKSSMTTFKTKILRVVINKFSIFQSYDSNVLKEIKTNIHKTIFVYVFFIILNVRSQSYKNNS